MATYRTTARNQIRTPSGAVGEAPDGPGGMATFADDVDNLIGVGGAEYAANFTAIQAIPAGRCFEGKMAFAADTKYRYRYVGGAWSIWSTPWANITAFASGIVTNTFGYPPAWRITDGDARLAGNLKKSSGASFADGDAILTVPTAVIPATIVYAALDASGVGIAGLQIVAGTGALSVHSMKGSTGIPWISLDGWGYRIS